MTAPRSHQECKSPARRSSPRTRPRHLVWASLAPFRMTIPEGCILNAPRPYPVSVGRLRIGHLLPDLMMGCLHQAVPERVTAEGASALWNPPLRGGSAGVRPGAWQPARAAGLRGHHVQLRRHRRAADARDEAGTAPRIPSGVRTMPVEATENVAPVVFWVKELRPIPVAPAARAAAPGRPMGGRRQGRSGNSRSTPRSIASPTHREAAKAAWTVPPAWWH